MDSRNKLATPGFCPFCKSELKPGATACTGCRAFETTEWDQASSYRFFRGFLFFVVPPILALFFVSSSPLAALIIWLAPIAGYFFYRSQKKSRIIWTVDGGLRI